MRSIAGRNHDRAATLDHDNDPQEWNNLAANHRHWIYRPLR
jgi:hypothetical protein